LLGLVAGCASALRARRRSSVLHTMPSKISDEEKQRRKEGALAVLRDAGADAFHTADEFYTRIGAALNIGKKAAQKLWLGVLKALPPGHELRQKYEAIKEKYDSSARSAASRLGKTGADSKSLAEARQERTAYEAARSKLPSTKAVARRLQREIKVATKATAAMAKEVMCARRDCACISGIVEAVDSYETAVMVGGSAKAVNVAPNGFLFVKDALVECAGVRWDDFTEEQAASFRKEDANERAYLDATRSAATATTSYPGIEVMASTIAASGVDGRSAYALGALERDVLEPLYLQALAVKDKRPSRAAKTAGDKARHAKAGDAYAGDGAVLRPAVALARPPGHFVRVADEPSQWLDDHEGKIEKIADGLELEHKFRCPARVVMMPHRSSDEYGRLAPSTLDVGAKLKLAKILVRLDKGRFILAAVRANGEPILLVVGRGMTMDMFVGIRAPPIEAADAETRLRGGGDSAVSFKHYRQYRSGAARMVAALRRVIVQMRLSGGDVAALVDRIMDQIDGRCEELAAGEAPTRGGTVPIDDSGDEGLGECPPGVDAADWATLKKGQESASFARLALASDFAAAASALLTNLRGGAPGDKCGNTGGSQDVQVPTGGAAPPVDDDAAELPAGSKRPKKKSRFARGQEADADDFLDWKFGPLDFDWATKANVKGAPAWAKPIKKGERLVDFWLRFSKPMAESVGQKYVVRHSSDAAPADVPGLVEAVDKCAAKARAGGEPAAKRLRSFLF